MFFIARHFNSVILTFMVACKLEYIMYYILYLIFLGIQVEFVQLVIDGLNKLIEMEKRLEEGKSIDDLIPPGPSHLVDV